MNRCCLGFAFDCDEGYLVALIEKERPDWQKGKLNGVGGKIGPQESPAHAMVREFEEEAGMKTHESDWRHFATMHGKDWECWCYTASLDLNLLTDEHVDMYDWLILDHDEGLYLPSVPWLIRLALDKEPFLARIEYLR